MIVEHPLTAQSMRPTRSTSSPQPKKEDLSKGFKANRAIYDYVFTDSSNERTFVGELDASAEVTVYSKVTESLPNPDTYRRL